MLRLTPLLSPPPRCWSPCRAAPPHYVPSFSTSDINECRQRVCRSDQQCKNTRGGYACIDLCPSGMTQAANGTCTGEPPPPLRFELVSFFCFPHDVFGGFSQTSMSAEAGRIGASTTRSARTGEAATAAPAPGGTGPKGWGAPASVRPSRPV